jgi:hypothetical protein
MKIYHNKGGQGLAEYMLLLALIAIHDHQTGIL